MLALIYIDFSDALDFFFFFSYDVLPKVNFISLLYYIGCCGKEANA